MLEVFTIILMLGAKKVSLLCSIGHYYAPLIPSQQRSQDFCIGGFQMGIVIVNVKPSAGGARPLGGSGGMPPREISKFVVPRNGISLILSINF